MLQHTHTQQPLTSDCPVSPAQQGCRHSAGCYSAKAPCAKVHTHVTAAPHYHTPSHTHTHITHMKPHPTHTFHTHIHEGPTEGAPHTHSTHTHLQQIHINAAASSYHNTRIACTLTHKLQHTHNRTIKHGRRTRVCNSQHTHTQRATQSRQHKNTYTHRDTYTGTLTSNTHTHNQAQHNHKYNNTHAQTH